MSKKVRRPQAPKRRNFVAKHEKELSRSGAGAHRDRSKYDRIEDYWQDELDDYLAGDDSEEDTGKEEFLAKLKGEEHDPDLRKEWEDWLDRQNGFDDYDDYYDY